VDKLYICKKCKKPESKQVKGKARKGTKLIAELQARDDLNLKVVPCKCLGKCKKGPNGIAMPGRLPLHRLSIKKIEKLASFLLF
jgi:predicted metal-binding protein